MQVLWWLAPPLALTSLAMVWAAWAGRTQDDVRRDDSDEARERMGRALGRPTPTRGRPVVSVAVEPTHGVALRGAARHAAAAARAAPGGPGPAPDGSR